MFIMITRFQRFAKGLQDKSMIILCLRYRKANGSAMGDNENIINAWEGVK